MSKKCRGGKTRKNYRRNRKGGFWPFSSNSENTQQSGEPSFFEKMKNDASSGWSSLTSRFSQKQKPPSPMQQPSYGQAPSSMQQPSYGQEPSSMQQPSMQQPSMQQSYGPSSGGKKYRRRRSVKRGGSTPIPYNPGTIWSDMSPFPQAVGGKRRTAKRGGSTPVPYNPGTVWSDMSQFPQAVGGKRTRNKRNNKRSGKK